MIFPTTSPTLIPPPAPSGYCAEDEHKDTWMKEFTMLLPLGLPYASTHCTKPFDQESTPSRRSTIAVIVQESLKTFNDVIEKASNHTLPSKRIPDLNGARWWNEAYSVAHMLARNAIRNEARHNTSHNLNRMISQAKWDWAHKRLHEAVDMANIWSLAKHHKGRRTALFPPLHGPTGTTVDTPIEKAAIFRDKFFLGTPTLVQL
jgi:hypothetical protein